MFENGVAHFNLIIVKDISNKARLMIRDYHTRDSSCLYIQIFKKIMNHIMIT